MRQGFSLVEILISVAFIAVLTLVLVSTVTFSHNLRRTDQEKTQAALYAQGAIEATQQLARSQMVNGSWHPVVDAQQKWSLAAGTELLDNKFTRQITISDVRRATQQNGQVYGMIVESGGYIDPSTKKLTALISWAGADGPKQFILESYEQIHTANRWVQTDWNGGSGQDDWIATNRFYSKDSGIDVSIPGVVSLTAGLIDWTQASTTDTYDTAGNFDDEDVYEKDGKAYLVTVNNSSGSEFYILNVSDPHNVYLLGSLNIGSSVYSVVVRGNYAYIATGDNSKELQVVDISNSAAPQVVVSYNLPSNTDAQDIQVDENEVYIIQGVTIYAYHQVTPSSLQLDSSLTVSGGNTTQIYLAQHYLYVATESSSQELLIYNVTTPSSMYQIGRYDLPGSLKATDVFVLGSRAYITTQNNGSGNEFFALDVSSPGNPLLLGSYNVGETVHSLAVVGPYALLGTNFLDKELAVLDVSVPGSISYISGFNLSGLILGMSANCSVVYAATSSNTEEFFVISTGITDCDYATSGQLESSTYDSGSDQVLYNWISWSSLTPANTSIQFQIATSNQINGPWSYLGPDGTSATYYTVGAKEFINYAANKDKRYIRYKLYLTSQADLQTPILEEVRLSYSIYE
ncbi:MAG: beta-propeller domain-containing protein [Candidatus Komeilibacteria bacterium]